MNWANGLTILRIILVPAFIAAILYYRLNVALMIFAVACVTDALDGYIARKFNQKTAFGAVLDPIADKLLIVSAFVCFSIVSGLPVYIKMPIYVPIIIISRDVIIVMGILIIYFLTGTMKIKPTKISKLTTVLQMTTIIALLLQFVYSKWMWNITVVLTCISGVDYIRIGMKQVNEKLS